KRTHFVWDGTRLLQEYTYKGSYTYLYTDQDSYEPLAQVFHNNQDEAQYLAYFHNDQVGIPREMTDIHGNLLWYGEYTAWGRLKKDGRVYRNVHQPFRLQNQYFDEETGLHYNLMRYYEPEAGRFVNQDPILLLGGSNLYSFASNTNAWFDPLGLKKKRNKKPRRIIPYDDIMDDVDKWSLVPVSQRQKCLIKDKLPSAKQRSVQQNRMMRKDFSRREKSLIREWERETGHTWPAGATPHHIIPLKNGGSNTWWNLTPVKHPHTGTIHGTGSALRTHLPYSTPTGIINQIVPR
ncbi:RHS repeat-associated core domain-containing protein, partial [Neisseria bergeri]